MSVYRQTDKKTGKPRGAFLYDFKVCVQGRKPSIRFFGSTSQKTRRAAEACEARLKELAALGQLSSDMTVEQACWRYWEEVAQHVESSDDQAKNLELISRFIGANVLLVTVTPDLISDAMRRRRETPIERAQVVGGVKTLAPTKLYPKPSTCNRQILEPLRRIMKRAKIIWRIPLDLEQFDWGALSYREPAPRTRELSVEEELRFWRELRPDYHPICMIYLISGRRRSDWVGFSKFKLDRTQGIARFPTRKRKEIGELVVDLTQQEMEIINSECDKAPDSEFVFTYEVQKGRDKGKRKKITANGLRKETDRAFKAAGLMDFHRHDFRHTFASRALRAGSDLRDIMRALDHQDISSTVRYTHVSVKQVLEVRERVKLNRQMPDNVTPIRGTKA